MVKTERIQKITVLGMMTALAYIFMLVSKLQIPFVPAVSFLQYDPKDIIIVIAGFIYGPFAAFITAFTVAFIELITVSDTQLIGLLMNVIATSSFSCTASYIYSRRRNYRGAVTGLVCAVFVLTGVMVVWNIIMTPIFMGVPRQMVIDLLIPGFIPFNLLKGCLNAAFIMLLYKPVLGSIKRTGILPADTETEAGSGGRIVLAGFGVLILCLAALLIMNSVI